MVVGYSGMVWWYGIVVWYGGMVWYHYTTTGVLVMVVWYGMVWYQYAVTPTPIYCGTAYVTLFEAKKYAGWRAIPKSRKSTIIIPYSLRFLFWRQVNSGKKTVSLRHLLQHECHSCYK
jgi:hypothetical protein